MFFGVTDFRLDERPFFAEKLLGEFTVSKADLLAEKGAFSGVVSSRGFGGFVESPHCEIVFPKDLFGVVSPFSAALDVSSGFSD
ncbi:hypothetical protein HJ140_22250 [Vibrio parahaemolyticus]|uniref:hypothetical protein n=1 Tax=Vibrio parahaemolyticus TaxID=670 RepID=UPI0015DE6460|nr:hypothetical protein [Vibrio parahaemolyticus]EHH1057569.1 hypothetical protein [Vibrio parahaemolyticus]MBE3972265.1 hypothetical protein [Vibrio parahaemolyticus]MBE4399431.1 hypothetical protein [Vibrio parahaemolyticus]MBE5118712.1 hypothetical protein [Vibrio parahaemolyticus]MBM5041594.1 hypothetical protein [Vibrio parahaemolyticus]